MKKTSKDHPVKTARLRLKLSPTRLAGLSGVSPAVVKRIEAGLPVMEHTAIAVIEYLQQNVPSVPVDMSVVNVYEKK